MPNATAIRDEVFVLPKGNDRYFLYAPLRRSVAEVNGSVVAIVARYLDDGPSVLNSPAQSLIESLKDQGVLGDPIPAPPLFPEQYDFQPHEVTLFLTSRCNLRCIYCYADAGKKSLDMPWEVARSAIDLVATNAGLIGSRKFGLGFHGGGEPTLAWNMLVRCVEYAREKAEQTGIDAEIYAATNGLLLQAQREFIGRHFTTLNISLDGPEDIQDLNRPKVNGAGSYRDVSETLRYFDSIGFRYGLRSTITAGMVGRMVEIVEKLHSEFAFKWLHIEPAWHCGRCLTSGAKPPSDQEYAANYLKAARRGMELGIAVSYSGARLTVLTSKFCAAPGDGFSVLPEGVATSCFEITEPSDPRADIFHYGRFDIASGAFHFDQSRIAALRRMSVEHHPYCSNCFCKWHCAGDCLAKVFERSGAARHEGSPRCDLNRILTEAALDEIVSNNSDPLANTHGESHA